MANAARLSCAKGRAAVELSTVMQGPTKVRSSMAEAAPASTAPTFGTSPTASWSSDSTMLVRMRAVLRRHQCTQQQEAVSVCMKQNALAKPSALQASPCGSYINALRYCELATQQHNYPVNTSYLY